MADIAIDIMVGVLFAFIILLTYMVIQYIVKYTSKYRRGGRIWFISGFTPWSIKVPNLKTSRYYDRFHIKYYTDDRFATIDDPIMQNMAEQLMKKWRYRLTTKYRKACIIQSFACQCAAYMYDKDRYGSGEKYQFPIATMYYRTGDCEDTSFVGATMAYLCGFDTVVIWVSGHIAYGVNTGHKFGTSFNVDGIYYQWCETTCPMIPGIYFGTYELKGVYPVTDGNSGFWTADKMAVIPFSKYDL